VTRTATPHPQELVNRESDELIARAREEHNPITVWCLFSGGNDSTVLAHRCRTHYDGLVYIDTGTAVPGVAEFARDFALWVDKPLRVLHARDAYRRLVLGGTVRRNGTIERGIGFPGPAMHARAYERLKEQQIIGFLRECKTGQSQRARVLFLSGVRRAESRRTPTRVVPARGIRSPVDFRQVKLGEGPLIRRPTEEWIEAECRHPALIPEDWFARAQADMSSRRTRQSNPRRRSQQRFYLPRGIVRCATGHNALRMQGKTRKGNTYYACGYRSAYGDNAAEALGHGKWQYIREDRLTDLIDRFFGTYVFGPNAVAHFRSQHAALMPALNDPGTD
jgi:hypothetical protein